MSDYNHDDYPLPEWAERRCRRSEPYLTERAQLCTRDGRRTGNAVVIGVTHESPCMEAVATVRTDAGNVIRLTENECASLFHRPIYIMRAEWVGSEGLL